MLYEYEIFEICHITLQLGLFQLYDRHIFFRIRRTLETPSDVVLLDVCCNFLRKSEKTQGQEGQIKILVVRSGAVSKSKL